jgi:hypothetical protein
MYKKPLLVIRGGFFYPRLPSIVDDEPDAADAADLGVAGKLRLLMMDD